MEKKNNKIHDGNILGVTLQFIVTVFVVVMVVYTSRLVYNVAALNSKSIIEDKVSILTKISGRSKGKRT